MGLQTNSIMVCYGIFCSHFGDRRTQAGRDFRFRFSEDRSIIADSLDGETTWRLVLKIAGKFF